VTKKIATHRTVLIQLLEILPDCLLPSPPGHVVYARTTDKASVELMIRHLVAISIPCPFARGQTLDTSHDGSVNQVLLRLVLCIA
jgi:hypothetical protein